MTRDEDARALLAELLGPLAERLRDVNLPLHILLEGRFGELNDNQLEMIHAAQDAARAADRVLREVQRLLVVREQSQAPGVDVVRVDDLLRAPLLLTIAAAEDAATRLEVDLPPQLPHVRVNRGSVEEAMTTILVRAVRATPGGTVYVTGTSTAKAVVVSIVPWQRPELFDLDLSLAEALLRECHGEVAASEGSLFVTMPVEVWESSGQ